jgi:Flp pilus assembly protein TadD/O-antigen ligase
MRPPVLGQLARGVLEATWLVALVAVPLFFNPRTERVFEPDKLAWVVVLGLLALWALAVGWVERPSLPAGRPRPVILAVALAVVVLVVGTVLSTVPTVSLWGTYRRGQGLLVDLALVLLFAAVARSAGSGPSRARVVRILALVTVPVALYALLQRLGIDNIIWRDAAAAVTERPFGPLGNPIFLGAWLCMTLPLVASGLLAALSDRRRGAAGATARAVAYASAGLLGLGALVVSQSRGPLLGLLAGAGTFGLLWAARLGRRRWVAGVVAGGVAVAIGLVALSMGAGAGLGRLGGLVAVGSRTAQQRQLVWDALARLAAADPRRALFGYGPETLGHVLPAHLSADLVRLVPDQVFDRAHNVVWEWWISAGLLGVVALVLLYATALRALLARAGLATDRGGAVRLYGLTIGGAGAGAVAAMVAGRPGYAGVGVPLGLLAGLLVAVVWPALRPGKASGFRQPEGGARGVPGGDAGGRGVPGADTGARGVPAADSAARGVSAEDFLAIGIVAGLVAHLVEGVSGLPTAAGEVVFWVYLGLAAALAPAGTSSGQDAEAGARTSGDAVTPAEGHADVRRRKGARASGTREGARSSGVRPDRTSVAPGMTLADALLAGVALASVTFAPLLVSSRGGTFGQAAIWLLPVAVWVGADLLAGGGTGRSWRVPAARLAVVVVVVAMLVVLNGPTGGEALAYGAMLVAATLAAGVALAGDLREAPVDEPWQWVVAASLVVLVAVAGWRLALAPVVADAHVRRGLEAAAQSDAAAAREHFERAIQLWPAQTAYATYIAAIYRDEAVDPDVADAQRDAAFRAGEAVLRDAFARVPDVGYLQKLGALQRDRADVEINPSARQTDLAGARTSLEHALALSPLDPRTLTDYGALLERLDDPRGARAAYEQAVDLGGPDNVRLVGLARSAVTGGDPGAAEKALAQALERAGTDRAAVGRVVDAGLASGTALPGASGTQMIYLVLTGRAAEARRLYAAVAAQAGDDGAVKALGEWLNRHAQPAR